MGQTLNRAAEWTSAKSSQRGKLEYTSQNEAILNKIISFCESFPSSHSEESELQFKSPLTWETKLNPDHFSPGDFATSGDSVSSTKKGKDGTALLTLERKDNRKYLISVRSFQLIAKVLDAAGNEKKIDEVRACLEANQDPVAKMLGDRFAYIEDGDLDSSDYRYVEEIMKTGRKTGDDNEESDETAEKMLVLKMLFYLREFDKKLLAEAIKIVSSEIRLDAAEVDRKVKLFSKYSGDNEERHILKYIHYTEPYTIPFENGARAYPQRQIHGDIAYIEIKPHDTEVFYVTASTSGYYQNRGFDSETKEISYNKEGDVYKDLAALCREKSAKFNELIDQHQIFNLEAGSGKQKVDHDYDTNHERDSSRYGRDDQVHRSHMHDKDGKKQDKKKSDEKKKKLEPSLKWKALEVEDEDKENQGEVARKKSSVKKRKGSHKMSRSGAWSDGDESFEESSSESEEEEETPDRRNETSSDLPSEYWQIQKLVKYLKGGNQTSTIIALCALRDFNLAQETCQLAIRDVGGLEVLINLLDTQEIKCKIGALRILKEISKNSQIRRAIADLGGLQMMVKILKDSNKQLKCLAAETIANVAKFRRARRAVRQHGGIKKLVGLLDCVPMGSVSSKEQEADVEVAKSGALALWSCSKSTHNKAVMRKAGVIPLLARLLKSPHENMLIPVVGTLQECATEDSYRLAIRTEGMIEDLVNNLKSENQELQMHCASAIFKCAEEKETRDLVRQFGGLDPLVSLLSNTDNKELLAAATGAIWKCSISHENVVRFQELKAIDLLVKLLQKQPEEVLVNVVGALSELAKDPPNRLAIRKAGGISPLVGLLTGTNQDLLVNVTNAIGQCAQEPDNMVVIDNLDGVRLLWSLLKNPSPQVQASAAWAICPCIEKAKDAGELVRSFVGGLELIVSLLRSDDMEVLASVSAAIANIASDEENLAVITDHGVVTMLAQLTNTTDDKLRRHLAEAIARCCNWGNNRINFGKEKAVAPLVKYLKSSDADVHRSTARALYQLSKNPDNCITMHNAGAVKPLVDMVGSEDEVLQEAAAGCIANIRRLALANEKARNKQTGQ